MTCNHELSACPNHDGGYDCTPFCATCEGSQGYCPECDPIECECCIQLADSDLEYSL